ncbi:MAG: GlsB/YeaQ/YmgE family stress response membrane protein [Bradyrhizobiaceae bacterium]|nr:GlsB/YeaQ/YmgE family stress response membrane protein [Bradyrhizobiaceae bacterium]
MTVDALITLLIVGAIAGWGASQIVKGFGYGLIGNVIVGVLGAFLAGWLLPKIGVHLGGGLVGKTIGAFIGAVILLFILGLVRR